jgi:UDP-N-acetylglucosamine/UDP-N-acetylgalactosamine diphosphorylase
MASVVEPGTDHQTSVRERYARHGQDHVFRFWDMLGAAARDRLLRQAAAIDLERLAIVHQKALSLARPRPRLLEPFPVRRLPEFGGDAAERSGALGCGEALLAEGRVGVLVVAGGEGSRLGFGGPKGAFPIGPLSNRSLLELLVQKLLGVARRYGRRPPGYIMTSPATDAAVRALFEEHDHFGFDREDLFFFSQQRIPSIDFEGSLILERPDRIAESADGHGASIPALLASGALEQMEERGISTVFYCHVDNPLVRIADPMLLGCQALTGAEVACKVVRKRDPLEGLGTLARLDGRPAVVEYTEIQEPHRSLRDSAGELVFWAGSIGVHALDVAFLRRVAADAESLLPYHASPKKIPTVDSSGRRVEPSTPNGYKLERFVFDALPAARSLVGIEGRREEEYSPIKSATGAASPESARRDLIACYRRWLDAAGIALPAGRDLALEIDHGWIDGPEDAIALGIRHASEARDLIRMATGVTG